MRKSQAILVLVILVASLCTAAYADVVGTVNINSADTTQLSYLPRVGAKAAQRIVDYRKEHGSFQKTTDLMQVKGFGQKSYDKLASYLTTEGKTTLSAKVSSPRKARKQPAHTASK